MKILLLAATSLFASEVVGPTLGHIAYRGTVRPVLGIAGASTLGDPAAALSRAVVAGRYALGCSGDHLVRVDLSSVAQTEIGPCAGAWSITRTGVAVVAGVSGVRVVALDGDRTIEGVQSSSCVASDGGDLLLCTTAKGILAIETSGASTLVLPGGTGAAFIPGSRDAVLADGTGLHLLRKGSEVSRVADIDAPSAVAATSGHAVAAAGRKLLVLRLADLQLETLEIESTPESFQPTANADVLHLAAESGPAWLLVTAAEGSRLLFVPQPEAASE